MLGSDYDNETINLMRVVIYCSTHSSSLCKLMLTSTFRPQCIKCCCNYTILPLEKHQQLHAECYIVGNRTSFSFTSPVIYNTELTELPWPWWLRTFINNNNFRFVLSPENDLWPSGEGATGHLDQKRLCLFRYAFINDLFIQWLFSRRSEVKLSVEA